jgi:branched-chain amino acid transport system ATP-binding protein/branched-chain amino acid transport system permease protein
MELWLNYVDQILLYAALGLSLNLLLGYAGQVSVAQAAFAAVGGYTMGYMATNYGWNFLAGTVLGMFFAFIVGSIVALPALKLSVEYLILLTLAVSSVIIGVFTTFPELGGTYGLIGLPDADLFGWSLDNPRDWVIPSLVAMLLVYAFCHRLGESAFGRVLKGVREDPMATQAMGKNVFAYKVGVFGITSALAGFAGAFLAAWFQLATPGVFGFAFSLTVFAIVIFGGMANLTGTVLGATVVVLLDPLLRRAVKMEASTAALVQLIVYGLALVVLMRVRPQGALPEGFSIWRRITKGKPKEIRIEMLDDWEPTSSVAVHQPGAGLTDEAEAARERIRERVWYEASVVLETSGVSKRFGGIVAADDLAIQLRRGTITALVGPNGAGKTTVFNLLTGFIRPDSGSVLLNGVELVGENPDKVARMGLVRSFQDVRLMHRLTCLQNVMLAVQNQAGENLGKLLFGGRAARRSEAETRDKAMDWLGFVGMAEFANIPAGSLSYGQSKLLSLSRVLATEADVLLLDEPASGIDTKWVDTVLDLIETVREQGRTVCIVEHNLHVVSRLADHTYFMELGRITAQGTIDELANSPRLAEAYFGTA